MHISIDISPVVYGTGVSVYLKNLVTNLVKVDNKSRFTLFGGSLRRRSEIKDFLGSIDAENAIGKVFPIAPTLADIMWNRFHIMPIELFVGKVDVFHSSDWTQPPSKAPKVTTIHDLVPVMYPEASHPRINNVHRRRLDWVRKEADKVIVPSCSTAEDVIRFGIPESKVVIIPEGVSGEYAECTPEDVRRIRKKFGISGAYILMVGTSHRKNLKNASQVFIKYRNNLKADLVVVGERPVGYKDFGGIKFLGHVGETDMPALYKGAEVFLYPSFYEGFGLPILESFSSGTPVVTSDLGSMKETAGNAGVLVNPTDVDSIYGGLKFAMANKKSLIKKGLERLTNFSWKKCATETLKVYRIAARG